MDTPQGYNPQETQAHPGRLPHERLRAVSRRGMVFEWVLAGLMVLVVNAAAVALLDRYDPNRFRVQVAVKYELLREHGGAYDSLILGDSTPNQGIVPEMLNERVGGDWLNLCTIANMLAASDAWLLSEYIDRYGPPKRVIVCHVPDMWPRTVDPAIIAQARVPLSAFDDLEPPVELGPAQTLRMAATRYAPLYSKNVSLNHLAFKPWQIQDLRSGFTPDGYMPTRGHQDHWSQAIDNAILGQAEHRFAVSEINALAMQRMIDLAQEHGFVIYLTPGSATEELAASPDYQHNFAAMIEQYRAWADSSDHLTLILPEPQTFPDALMYDEDHVNTRGAAVWTERIARAMLEAESNAQPEAGP